MGGTPARAVIAEIVGVRAVEHKRNAVLLRDPGKLPEQFPLAVVAPVLGIRAVFRTVEFGCSDDLVAETEFAGIWQGTAS